jgi:hypothetical protein
MGGVTNGDAVCVGARWIQLTVSDRDVRFLKGGRGRWSGERLRQSQMRHERDFPLCMSGG